VKDALAAFALPLQALRLLWREKGLRRMACLPALLSLLAVAAALAAVVAQSEALYQLASSLVPEIEAGEGWAWLWAAPARLLLHFAEVVVFLALVLGCVIGALLVASVAAAPLHDALSRKVERVVTGGVREESAEGVAAALRQGARAVHQELRRIVFFVVVTGSLGLLGLVVPGAQIVVAPALALFGALFLTLDHASYVLDRRGLSFRAKWRWARRHAPATLAFGGAALLVCAVPGLNFVAMPVLVAAGTLLVLRHPPHSPPTTRAGFSPGSPTSS
jgi:uncharacterized protein involved in cysteine biosynthesis